MTFENETTSARIVSTITIDERGDARGLAPAQHHTEAEHGADHVGAGVAEHQALVRGRRAGARSSAPITGAIATPAGLVPSTIASGT